MSHVVARPGLIASLSHALDLAEGQRKGHAVRTCLIGMEIAEAIGLGAGDRWDLFYALLLKDAGGSATASPLADAFQSDDRRVKRDLSRTDWAGRLWAFRGGLRHAAIGAPLWLRLPAMARLLRRGSRVARELFGIRAVRGAEVARELGFPASTATAIRNLDEHWDGRGYPAGVRGASIPLISRIGCLAKSAEVHLQDGGPDAVMEMVRSRRGRWFDPELADVVLGWEARTSWWSTVRVSRDADSLRGLEPRDRARPLTPSDLDGLAAVWADVIDAKSPYMLGHSRRVGELTRRMARRLDLSRGEQRRLHRAGLLHDIGKLAVSSRILNKAGGLNNAEWKELREHPRHTLQLLQRIPVFRPVARTAAHHHERLDGSGYPWGVDGGRLDVAARALAVADAFEAYTAGRPFRPAVPRERALEALRGEAGLRLDADMVDLVAECLPDGPENSDATIPTPRLRTPGIRDGSGIAVMTSTGHTVSPMPAGRYDADTRLHPGPA